MNKRITLIISILIVTLLLSACNMVSGPKGVEGEKEVTINIVNKNEDVDEKFTYTTDHQFLLELLEEKEEELGVTFESSDMGKMVVGMMDYVADPNNQEFFLIVVNNEDAMIGVGEIPLKDRDVYKFELTNY